MKTEAMRPGNEARWEWLVEAETCGELSEAERVELHELAEQDEVRRQERRVLAAIAELTPLDPDLSAEDERMIDDVLKQHSQHGHRHKATLWLTAAAVLIPLAAAAAYLPRMKGADESPGERAPMTEPSAAPSGTTSSRKQAAREKQDKPEPVSEPAQTSSPPSTSPSRPPTAAELLARAQKARSVRNYGKAAQAYQHLLRLYPASSEAQLAQVSLAQLQLAQGNAAAALVGFDAYQRSGGALSQEAHYGKIQALYALGRTAQERAEIRIFLARYPKALQTAALKRRLGAEAADE